jgi:hypothetical protein
MASKYDSLRVNVHKLKAGEAYVATYPEDFTCQPESFRNVVFALANAAGHCWKGTCAVTGRHVIYAFYKASDFMRPHLPAYPIVKKMRGE